MMSDGFKSPGFRPYVFGAAGVAETDGKIYVHYSPIGDPRSYNLEAWKRSGHSFAGLGLGVQAAYRADRAVLAEVSFRQFLGPMLPVVAIQLGYAYGI